MNIGKAQSIVDAWKTNKATMTDLLELRDALPGILDDAIAWRKGHEMLRELQARVMPCGHAMENLIGGEGSVTKCGECLVLKRATDSERRAPIQGDSWRRKGSKGYSSGTITWEEHEEIWRAYNKKWGNDQDAERIAFRGGFGYGESIDLIGHAPVTWKPVSG